MTTKSSVSYTAFEFKNDDTLLFGRESAGVPENIHNLIKYQLKIPMINNKRSLNMASSVAIILSENLRQTGFINNEKRN
jgi:tRNA (cytidine/uridine-2'-O-)-methyltransferase